MTFSIRPNHGRRFVLFLGSGAEGQWGGDLREGLPEPLFSSAAVVGYFPLSYWESVGNGRYEEGGLDLKRKLWEHARSDLRDTQANL
jgi:hypothetical protein